VRLTQLELRQQQQQQQPAKVNLIFHFPATAKTEGNFSFFKLMAGVVGFLSWQLSWHKSQAHRKLKLQRAMAIVLSD